MGMGLCRPTQLLPHGGGGEVGFFNPLWQVVVIRSGTYPCLPRCRSGAKMVHYRGTQGHCRVEVGNAQYKMHVG